MARLAALAQTDIKRLVAYSSVSHMGFIVLGIFAFNATGLDGSAIQMVNHGLTTGALFACVGMIYERYHTRDMTQLGGLWNRLPILAFFLILAALGSAAVPGLNGFVGEFPILAGAFQTSRPGGVSWERPAWSWVRATCSGCCGRSSSAHCASPRTRGAGRRCRCRHHAPGHDVCRSRSAGMRSPA